MKIGEASEALSVLCNGEAWLVCLSECHHGDRQPALLVEQSLFDYLHDTNAQFEDYLCLIVWNKGLVKWKLSQNNYGNVSIWVITLY